MTAKNDNNKEQIKNKEAPIICLKDIAVAYQNDVAIFDINMDIYRNEFIGICGPNGSGKSTIIKTMVGALEPFQGKVRVFGKDITNSADVNKIRRRIGYLPQIDNIDRNFPALVKDVVAMGLYAKVGLFRGLNDSNYESVLRALEIVEMEDATDRPIGHLSGGQQQKVMIARGIVNEPDILILDEPTSALDFKVAKNIMEIIRKIQTETNLTIVLVSHDIDFLKENCSRVFCVNKRLVWEGNPRSEHFDVIINSVFLK